MNVCEIVISKLCYKLGEICHENTCKAEVRARVRADDSLRVRAGNNMGVRAGNSIGVRGDCSTLMFSEAPSAWEVSLRPNTLSCS